MVVLLLLAFVHLFFGFTHWQVCGRDLRLQGKLWGFMGFITFSEKAMT